MSTVRKWGNSLANRFPRALAGQMDVCEGTAVELHVRGGELVVRPSGLADHLRNVDWRARNIQLIHCVSTSELSEVGARIEALLVHPDA